MSYTTVGAVTGANKGIGFAIVRQLALQYPKSPYNKGDVLIYLTARDQSRGEQAIKDLHSDPALKKAKALKQDGGLTTVKFHPLDISQTNSIRKFADHLKQEHPEGIDFAINNAGIALQGFDYEVVKETLQCNYYGTLEATQDFLPLMKDGGRIVNVASMVGKLNKYSDEIKNKFLNAKSHDEVTALMEDFCPLGRNLWQLLVNQKDTPSQPQPDTAPGDHRANARAAHPLGAATLLGQYSHGTAHSFLGAADGSELMRVWKMPGPKYLSGKVKATLSAQLQEAAWEMLEEKDLNGHEAEQEPVIVGTNTKPADDAKSVSSVATATTAHTDGDDISGQGVGRVKGWTKLKSRNGE